jgi:hypothetical protein
MGRNITFEGPDPNGGHITNVPSEYARRVLGTIVGAPPVPEAKADKRQAARDKALVRAKEKLLAEIQPLLKAHIEAVEVAVQTRHKLEGLLGVIHARSRFARDEYSSYELTDAILPVLEKSAADLPPVDPDGYVQTRWDLRKSRDYWKERFTALLKGKGK